MILQIIQEEDESQDEASEIGQPSDVSTNQKAAHRRSSKARKSQDNISIDFDALRAEVANELEQKIKAELDEKVEVKMQERLEEMRTTITQHLTDDFEQHLEEKNEIISSLEKQIATLTEKTNSDDNAASVLRAKEVRDCPLNPFGFASFENCVNYCNLHQ